VLPIDKDEQPDLETLAQLDREAKGRGQNILFMMEEVAKNFHDFYDKFLTNPLARDLERGAEGKRLREYFEYEEFAKVPDNRIHSPEKVEKVTQDIARGLLGWLRPITPEKILEDTRSTLGHHYDKGLAEATLERGYHYKSQYVEISANKSEGPDKSVTTFLMPARGYGIVKEGYEGVHYPMYYVLTRDNSRHLSNRPTRE
jgi:hypothetical protein